MRRGLTLIEILLVIAIIALLAALLLPVLSRARERGREAVCMTRAHAIGQAVRMYADDYDAYLPIGAYNSLSATPTRAWDTTWHDLLLPYLSGKQSALSCPSVDASFGPRYSYGASPWLLPYYGAVPEWSLGPGDKLWMAEHATGNWPALPRDFYDDAAHSYLTARHNGRVVVLYLDGHVRSVLPESLSGQPALWRP